MAAFFHAANRNGILGAAFQSFVQDGFFFPVSPESRSATQPHEYAIVGPVITLVNFELFICANKEDHESLRGRNVLNVREGLKKSLHLNHPVERARLHGHVKQGVHDHEAVRSLRTVHDGRGSGSFWCIANQTVSSI